MHPHSHSYHFGYKNDFFLGRGQPPPPVAPIAPSYRNPKYASDTHVILCCIHFRRVFKMFSLHVHMLRVVHATLQVNGCVDNCCMRCRRMNIGMMPIGDMTSIITMQKYVVIGAYKNG